ncbi:MAG: permease prefix domain 1-containing protein [Candidatus Saccharicenans sp.]|uniref:permease prefix domain 1-containing protein n=1 Tax=Candidatus Saccharicenans sp. TaxID=2819258 RepID=UPI00404A7C9B
MTNRQTLEEKIAEWRDFLMKKQAISSPDVDELEDHLKSQVEALTQQGLDEDEAFLVAVKRLGDLDSITREFAVEYSERLWKQLVLAGGPGPAPTALTGEDWLAVGLAIASAAAVKIPALFGLRLWESPAQTAFFLRNLSFFVLPFLAIFFAIRRRLDKHHYLVLISVLALSGLAVNLLPLRPQSHTLVLTAIHLPIALWLFLLYTYSGVRWRQPEQRMNYLRFSGEWFIYYTLIALGGFILTALTIFIFEAIGLKVESVVQEWVLPCGVLGAVIIAAWLVEHKKSVIENMAPVLTWLFTPLFTILLLVFVAVIVLTGRTIDIKREVLIGFDLLLVLVLGFLLYSISARSSDTHPNRFDLLQLVLVVSAIIVDILALWAMAARISEFGFSPNKTAALGLNLILLVNLTRSAWLYLRFLLRRIPFTRLERWQTDYLPVYAIWALIVVLLFPVLFGYK